MDGKRRAKWMLGLVGSALIVLAYVLSYLWIRQGHYLVHRVAWGGEEWVHDIATGDPGQMNDSWWYITTHTLPWVVFSPLRWLEVEWWYWQTARRTEQDTSVE